MDEDSAPDPEADEVLILLRVVRRLPHVDAQDAVHAQDHVEEPRRGALNLEVRRHHRRPQPRVPHHSEFHGVRERPEAHEDKRLDLEHGAKAVHPNRSWHIHVPHRGCVRMASAMQQSGKITSARDMSGGRNA